MELIVDYFSNMPKLHRSGLLIGGLTIFFLIENAAPLFKLKYNKPKQIGVNIFFTLTTVLVNLSMAVLLIWTADWVVGKGFGIIQWIAMPLWAKAVFGVLLLDFFGAWLAHYTEHRIKWMWKFHLVHHTDKYVNTTTGNRHHPGESVIRFVFTLIGVIAVGAPMWVVMIYQSLSVVMTQFSHANVNMPKWLDNALVLVVCTPNMHRVHHHYRLPYSDTNFGNIFSFWDRIFGTYIAVDNKKLVYGVDTYFEETEADNLGSLLKIPFKPYRPPIEWKDEEKL